MTFLARLISLLLVTAKVSSLSVENVDKFPIQMPSVKPKLPETYLCTTIR